MQFSTSAQNLEIAKNLFMDVVCAFYTDIEYIVADYLVRYKYLSEKDVMEDKVLKLHHKFAKRALNKLESGAMIQSFNFQNRARDSEGKTIIKSDYTKYYYINYDHFVNVLTYRLYQMYQVQVSNESYNRSSDKERFECEGTFCKQRFRVVDVVSCFDDTKSCYFCPLCHSNLKELEGDSVEDSAETMQEKIKSQVNSTLEKYHSDLIGTLELLKGQQIHPIHPKDSIEKELKEEYLSGTPFMIRTGGGGGGGGRLRSLDTRAATIEIIVEIEDEKYGKKSSSRKTLAPLPVFLTHSTVEETEARNARLFRKREEVFSDEDNEDNRNVSLFDFDVEKSVV